MPPPLRPALGLPRSWVGGAFSRILDELRNSPRNLLLPIPGNFSATSTQGLRIKPQLVYQELTFAFLGIAKVYMFSKLVASLATLPGPRCAGRIRHRFLDLLVIAVCAVIAGAETWVDIAGYGRMKPPWLATFLDLPHGIPSHDTFRRVFSLVDLQGL